MEYKVFYGGWYQRTTLHLTEIYDFFAFGKSKLKLDSSKLNLYHQNLGFKKVSRESGYLEFVSAETENGILVKYFEDGLYVLERDSKDIPSSVNELEAYFEKVLNPAISYIFSLGAPTPKILANIKQDHPVVVFAIQKDHGKYNLDSKLYGEVYSKISADKFTVYKTPKYIFIVADKSQLSSSTNLVEMQIFFREFKDQLERYLNIHRNIWEDITEIKDGGKILGKDVSKTKIRLDSYDRSISLINNRINQMGTYVKTRQSIAKELGVELHLSKIFDYKFETLINTLAYIKEIWLMTKDYVKNVSTILSDIENQSLNNSLKSLQVITSIGVVSGIIGYLSKSEIPTITKAGWGYLAILLFSTLILNLLVITYYKNIKYKLKISDTSTKI
jgi:hypothetical protein